MSNSVRQNGPQVWAHRGLGDTARENTLGSFLEALDQGAVGAELDVRTCASGELVVFHDADLQRMAGRPERVADLSFDALRAVSWADGLGRIPTLAEVADVVCPRGTLNVELKADVPDLETAVARLHRELTDLPVSARERILVSSFHHGALARLHDLGVPRLGALLDPKRPLPTLPKWAVAVHPSSHHCTHDSISSWRARGLAIHVWTVNDPAEAQRLAALGVDALITDDVPAILDAL